MSTEDFITIVGNSVTEIRIGNKFIIRNSGGSWLFMEDKGPKNGYPRKRNVPMGSLKDCLVELAARGGPSVEEIMSRIQSMQAE